MNCTDFRQQLEATLDRRTSDLRELQTHAAACPECAVQWDEHLLLEAAIKRWKPLRPSVDLTDRVLAQWRLERAEPLPEVVTTVSVRSTVASSKPSRRAVVTRTRHWPIVTTIALILVMVTMALRLQQPRRELQVVKHVPPTTMAVGSDEGLADLTDIIADAKSAWWGLARSTAERTSGLSVFVPELSMSAESSSTPGPGPIDPLSEDTDSDLTPVPKDLRRAFEFLINAAEAGEATTT